MFDWMSVLKVKQIITPTTDINIKKVPKKKKPEDKKCCEEAAKAYVILQLAENMDYTRILLNGREISREDIEDGEWGEHPSYQELIDYEEDGTISEKERIKMEQSALSWASSHLHCELLKSVLRGSLDMNYRGHAGNSAYQKIIDEWERCERR